MEITAITSILTKSEMNKFGKFVSSPFFNTEQRFIKLYDIVKSEGKDLTRETIACKMFNGKVSSADDSFRKLISEFMKLFERFLSELEISEDSFRLKTALAKQLVKRKLMDRYYREVKKAEIIIDGNVKDENYYLQMLELYTFRYQTEDFNFNSWKEDLSFSVNNLLDKYFVTYKLLMMQRFISVEYIFLPAEKLDKTFIDAIDQYINKNKEELKQKEPVLYLRYLMYEMIADPYAKELLNEYLLFLDETERSSEMDCKMYYEDLINYYTLLINLGKDEFEREIIFVARIMDKRGYFKSGISTNDYRIISEAAINNDDFSWGEEFLERNKDFINDTYRESIYAACSAKINFFKKDYQTSRKFISMVSYDDFMRYAESKLIECRILYEETRIPELLAVTETTQKYLKSNKNIGTHYKETYLFFLNSLKKLTWLVEKVQINKEISYELEKLESEIEQRKSQLYGKSWLIEKISDLKDNLKAL